MNVTVIVPSLDPDEKLMQVVEGLLAVGFRDIVLVNDGSHAERAAPFALAAQRPEVTVLTHEVNRGKGCALKTAFAWCLEHRPDIDGVVTADGDNQHRAEDILRCAEKMAAEPDKVWLGVRDFSLEQVPLRSRMGNTLTRGIMRLACGVAVTDTQTGLRAIPAACLPLMCEVEGERYEYETEMLIALRGAKIGIGEVVIETVYIDENQTSHFNTLRDSWKIYKLIFRHMFRSLASFLKFSASSLAAVGVELGIFTLLNTVVFANTSDAVRLAASTVLGRVVSSALNFSANYRLVFRSQVSVNRAALRYTILCVVQTLFSYGLVWAFTETFQTHGLEDTVVKMGADTLLFFASFQFQKRWVYKA